MQNLIEYLRERRGVKYGDSEKIVDDFAMLLVNKPKSIIYDKPKGSSLVWYAVRYRVYSVLEFLLDMGAYVGKNGKNYNTLISTSPFKKTIGWIRLDEYFEIIKKIMDAPQFQLELFELKTFSEIYKETPNHKNVAEIAKKIFNHPSLRLLSKSQIFEFCNCLFNKRNYSATYDMIIDSFGKKFLLECLINYSYVTRGKYYVTNQITKLVDDDEISLEYIMSITNNKNSNPVILSEILFSLKWLGGAEYIKLFVTLIKKGLDPEYSMLDEKGRKIPLKYRAFDMVREDYRESLLRLFVVDFKLDLSNWHEDKYRDKLTPNMIHILMLSDNKPPDDYLYKLATSMSMRKERYAYNVCLLLSSYGLKLWNGDPENSFRNIIEEIKWMDDLERAYGKENCGLMNPMGLSNRYLSEFENDLPKEAIKFLMLGKNNKTICELKQTINYSLNKRDPRRHTAYPVCKRLSEIFNMIEN